MRANYSWPHCYSAVLMPLDAADSRPQPGNRAAAPPPRSIRKTWQKWCPGSPRPRSVITGEPWRTVQYNDLDEVENEFWEYRGKDSQGPYRVHIEFDKRGMVLIVGKIPDTAPGVRGTPAKRVD